MLEGSVCKMLCFSAVVLAHKSGLMFSFVKLSIQADILVILFCVIFRVNLMEQDFPLWCCMCDSIIQLLIFLSFSISYF